jgi:hypothetical protein
MSVQPTALSTRPQSWFGYYILDIKKSLAPACNPTPIIQQNAQLLCTNSPNIMWFLPQMVHFYEVFLFCTQFPLGWGQEVGRDFALL